MSIVTTVSLIVAVLVFVVAMVLARLTFCGIGVRGGCVSVSVRNTTAARRTSGRRREFESRPREREKRTRELELRPLDSSQREEFQQRWIAPQGEFVDDPGRAVRDAERLVVKVMSARGYPVRDFEGRAGELSGPQQRRRRKGQPADGHLREKETSA
jgi:hypothetical protein